MQIYADIHRQFGFNNEECVTVSNKIFIFNSGLLEKNVVFITSKAHILPVC